MKNCILLWNILSHNACFVVSAEGCFDIPMSKITWWQLFWDLLRNIYKCWCSAESSFSSLHYSFEGLRMFWTAPMRNYGNNWWFQISKKSCWFISWVKKWLWRKGWWLRNNLKVCDFCRLYRHIYKFTNVSNLEFCTRGREVLPLSQSIRLYAAQTYAMKGVFDVNSSVRLSAIANLSMYPLDIVILSAEIIVTFCAFIRKISIPGCDWFVTGYSWGWGGPWCEGSCCYVIGTCRQWHQSV